MQHRIKVPSRLLNKKGELIQREYALTPLLKYRRRDVARKLRLKEWDYYLIYNEEHAIGLTIGNSNTLLLISATLIDFSKKQQHTKSILRIVPDRYMSMPESSEEGNIIYRNSGVTLAFTHQEGCRQLYLNMKKFHHDSDLEVHLKLCQEPKDSMVIATPFKENSKDFYYNRKIIGMNASGMVTLSGESISFHPTNSFGLLDWGRGVWPYKTTWYWGIAQGNVCGNVFGFNLGYGFGNTYAATENMLFYNGVASKLADIKFHIPKDGKNQYDYLKPWKVTSSDRRLEMEFTPILDRNVYWNAIAFSTNQHQVFGKYSGNATLDDGTIIYVKDFPGFIEHVENRW
jgi:hypothetical protein